MSEANDEMILGYCDGLDLHNLEPSSNRSHSYRHGFANGRDDGNHSPRSGYDELIRRAELAILQDEIPFQ